MASNFQYIYGPVHSWRLGMSLGVDPISTSFKTCNFDCVYCQLGKTAHWEDVRQVFVPTGAVIREIKDLAPEIKIDHITFSGRGETTLAANLGEMIREVRQIRPEKVAVITNSTLLSRDDVQQELLRADTVLAKLDACSEETFQGVDRAMDGVYFKDIINGIKKFRTLYKGKLALQMMFVEANKPYASQMADIARQLNPDEIELNTPLRPSAVSPLSKAAMAEVAAHFEGLPFITVYDEEVEDVDPIDKQATIKRHGQF